MSMKPVGDLASCVSRTPDCEYEACGGPCLYGCHGPQTVSMEPGGGTLPHVCHGPQTVSMKPVGDLASMGVTDPRL